MLRISKKLNRTRQESALIRLFTTSVAVVVLALFILSLGKNPLEVYGAMFKGSIGSLYRFKDTLILTIPLTLSALGVGLAFKMKFWNIGGEGQIIMGAFMASFFALKLPLLPHGLVLPLMIIGGFIGGGLWALLPTLFKVRFDTNETLFTLMLNYIAIKFVVFLQYGPWRDPLAQGFPKIPNFPEWAVLPDFLGIHIGWVLSVFTIVIVHILLNHTKAGFEISVIGNSMNTARYAGMEVDKVILKTLFLSGGLCGLAGVLQASGVNETLTADVSGGIGYTAIIVAWLSGVQPLFIPIVAFLFSMMNQGADFIQTAFQIPKAAADILQGLILFSALAGEFLIQYSVKWVSVKSSKEVRG